MNTGMFLTVSKEIRETKKVELKIPKEWGMFTSQGNRSLRLKAERLVAKIKDEKDFTKRLRAITLFFKSYRKMSDSKNMGEADDTAVRELVYDFALKLGKCVGISSYTIDDIWESDESHP